MEHRLIGHPLLSLAFSNETPSFWPRLRGPLPSPLCNSRSENVYFPHKHSYTLLASCSEQRSTGAFFVIALTRKGICFCIIQASSQDRHNQSSSVLASGRPGAPKRIHVPAAPTFTDFRVPTFSSRGSPIPLFGWHDFPILCQRSSHQHLSTDLRSRGLKRVLLISKHSRRFPRFRTNLTTEEAVDEIVRVPALTSSYSRIPGPFPFSSNPSAAVLACHASNRFQSRDSCPRSFSHPSTFPCLRTSNVHGHLPLLLRPTLYFPACPNCFSIGFQSFFANFQSTGSATKDRIGIPLLTPLYNTVFRLCKIKKRSRILNRYRRGSTV